MLNNHHSNQTFTTVQRPHVERYPLSAFNASDPSSSMDGIAAIWMGGTCDLASSFLAASYVPSRTPGSKRPPATLSHHSCAEHLVTHSCSRAGTYPLSVACRKEVTRKWAACTVAKRRIATVLRIHIALHCCDAASSAVTLVGHVLERIGQEAAVEPGHPLRGQHAPHHLLRRYPRSTLHLDLPPVTKDRHDVSVRNHPAAVHWWRKKQAVARALLAPGPPNADVLTTSGPESSAHRQPWKAQKPVGPMPPDKDAGGKIRRLICGMAASSTA